MWRLTAAVCAFSTFASSAGFAGWRDDRREDRKDPAASVRTASPIKHVIILIGENRGLDHTFGIYKPKGKNQTISNILSKGIVNADGTPGPHFALSQQYSVAAQSSYYIGAPKSAKKAYSATNLMPQPNTNGAPSAQSTTGAPFSSVALVAAIEKDVEQQDISLLTTGATGLPPGVLDTRVPGASTLNGPFQLLGPNLTDDDYTGDTTHRFFQAWQQQDCSLANATKANPSGCLNDLFPFVMATYSASNKSLGNSMGFYNTEEEQVSLFKTLADRFTLSDNYHQPILGGTAVQHQMIGTADDVYWSDGLGNATVPPASLVANPNPVSGTINQYTADNNFVNCSDYSQPGIKPIIDYINALPYNAEPNCKENHYYMINNVNPGYLPNGALSGAGNVPPSSVKTIGDALIAKKISWAYFGGAFNDAVILSNEAVALNPVSPNLSVAALADPPHALGTAYCGICNPFAYATSIMADASVRTAHLKDTADLIADIQNDTLPSVSYGKPDGLLDGHPSSSKYPLFEAYTQKILDALDANPALKATTAVFITVDEAGGYWDSGYIQPLDFFGDGPRIPLLILSPYTTGGKITHSYADHASLVKFIERNWELEPLTDRSRDNLPNPIAKASNPYVPINPPAIDDLFSAFDFSAAPNNQPYTE